MTCVGPASNLPNVISLQWISVLTCPSCVGFMLVLCSRLILAWFAFPDDGFRLVVSSMPLLLSVNLPRSLLSCLAFSILYVRGTVSLLAVLYYVVLCCPALCCLVSCRPILCCLVLSCVFLSSLFYPQSISPVVSFWLEINKSVALNRQPRLCCC
jgi:hypothetical protein